MMYQVCSVRVKTWGPVLRYPIRIHHTCRFWGIDTQTLITLWATISSPGHLLTLRPLILLSVLPGPMLCLGPKGPLPNMGSTQSNFPTWPRVCRGLLPSTGFSIG